MTFLPTIEVEEVSKTFWIPHEQRARLKEYFAHPFKRVRYERNDALRGVTFSVQPGEFFGVIGANGSGKSTLLKLLAPSTYRMQAESGSTASSLRSSSSESASTPSSAPVGTSRSTGCCSE